MDTKLAKLILLLKRASLHREAMFVHDLASHDSPNIVAFKENIWIFDEKSIISWYSDNEQTIIKQMADVLQFEVDEETSISDLLQDIKDTRPDVLVGNIIDNKLAMDQYGDPTLHPKHSILIKKVVEQLKLDGVIQNNEQGEAITHYPESMTGGKLGESPILYHGTSSKHFPEIMRTGLVPSPQHTNFKKVIHREHVFLTSNLSKAQFHATHATARGYQPIVIELQVPDVNKLDSDYDVDISTGESTFKNQSGQGPMVRFPLSREDSGPFPLSKEFGIFSYRGRIPASFIKGVYIAYDEDETWYWYDYRYDPQEYLQDLMAAQEMDMLPRPGFSAEEAIADRREMYREDLIYNLELQGRDEEFESLEESEQERILDEFMQAGEVKF